MEVDAPGKLGDVLQALAVAIDVERLILGRRFDREEDPGPVRAGRIAGDGRDIERQLELAEAVGLLRRGQARVFEKGRVLRGREGAPVASAACGHGLEPQPQLFLRRGERPDDRVDQASGGGLTVVILEERGDLDVFGETIDSLVGSQARQAVGGVQLFGYSPANNRSPESSVEQVAEAQPPSPG